MDGCLEGWVADWLSASIYSLRLVWSACLLTGGLDGSLAFWLCYLLAAWRSAIVSFAGCLAWLAGLSEFVGLLCLLAVWLY